MPPQIYADFTLYRRLLTYVAPLSHIFVLAIISMIVLAATAPLLAVLMKTLTDGALVDKNPQTIVLVPYQFVGLFFIRGLAAYCGNAALHWVGSRVIMSLQFEMFNRLLNCPSRFFDDRRSGDIVSRFTFDVLQIKEAATNVIATMVRDSLSVIGLLGWMFYLDWVLASISLLGAPLVASVVSIIRKQVRNMSRRVQETMSHIHNALYEALEAQKIIKIYGGATSEKQRYLNTIKKHRRFLDKQVFTAQASSPSVQLITGMLIAVIIYLATQQAIDDSLTVGDFSSFFTAIFMLLDPLKRLAGINEHLQRGLAACESVFDLIDEDIEIDEGTQTLVKPYGKIEFRSVSFAYENSQEYALDNISFTIKPGETVALVGESGSGKTTLANLLPRFYEPRSGIILYDDIDIRKLSLTELRKNIAFVSQDVVLFNDTVRNNIAYGDLQGKDAAAIEKATAAAYATEFINNLPKKMDTIIGEDGMRLSGGQRQRLAIARALLKDARLLIMDEATSALDTKSERHIQLALENVKQGRTCLIIAHRLSTIENADRIIVLYKGRIVEQGRHEELLQLNNHYAKLYQVQFEGNGLRQ